MDQLMTEIRYMILQRVHQIGVGLVRKCVIRIKRFGHRFSNTDGKINSSDERRYSE